MPSNNEPSKRLFVGSLPYKFSEGELLALFIPFGKVVVVKIVLNQWGKSRGMGYVEYDDLESAQIAKNKMHGYKMVDRSIIVDYAQPDPYLTEEGMQRHIEAESKKSKHHRPNYNITTSLSRSVSSPKSSSSLPRTRTSSPKFNKDDAFGQHVRQTVYDSRYHGSKVGAKFASRSRKKK